MTKLSNSNIASAKVQRSNYPKYRGRQNSTIASAKVQRSNNLTFGLLHLQYCCLIVLSCLDCHIAYKLNSTVMTVATSTGVATMGPRGAMAPSLLSCFSAVSMSWFTFAIASILCCGPLTCLPLATPLATSYIMVCELQAN